MKNLIEDTQNLALGQETTNELKTDKNILENANTNDENLSESQENTGKNVDDLTKTTQESTSENGEYNSDTNTLNPRSLSFWIGLIAVVLASLEGLLIMFNVNLEINLLVEGLSTILFTLVCMGILKTNNKDVSKQDIATNLEESLKSKKKKSQDKTKTK